MARRNKLEAAVFDFILVSGGSNKSAQHVTRLRVNSGAIVTEQGVVGVIAELRSGHGSGIGLRAEGIRVGGVVALLGVVAVLPSIGFGAADFVAPVGAGRKIPASIGAEDLLCITLVETWRSENRLAGDAGVAGVVAEREAELVSVGERITKISGERAIDERVVKALAVGMEISGRGGVIEFADEAAEIATTARGGKVAALGKNGEGGDARITAMGEELDHAGDGIAAVERALRAADDFDLVNIFGGEAGEIDAAAGRIDGRAVHQHLGEIGIPAVQENGGGASGRAGAVDGDAGRELQQLRQRRGLTFVYDLAGNDIGGRGGLRFG